MESHQDESLSIADYFKRIDNLDEELSALLYFEQWDTLTDGPRNKYFPEDAEYNKVAGCRTALYNLIGHNANFNGKYFENQIQTIDQLIDFIEHLEKKRESIAIKLADYSLLPFNLIVYSEGVSRDFGEIESYIIRRFTEKLDDLPLSEAITLLSKLLHLVRRKKALSEIEENNSLNWYERLESYIQNELAYKTQMLPKIKPQLSDKKYALKDDSLLKRIYDLCEEDVFDCLYPAFLESVMAANFNTINIIRLNAMKDLTYRLSATMDKKWYEHVCLNMDWEKGDCSGRDLGTKWTSEVDKILLKPQKR